MQKSASGNLLWISAIFQWIYGITTLALAYRSVNAPEESGEFALLKNASTALFGWLAITSSTALILIAFFLIKRNRAAYISSLILIPLCMLITGAGSISGLTFEISPGAPISITSEVIPVLLFTFLLLSYKEFKK